MHHGKAHTKSKTGFVKPFKAERINQMWLMDTTRLDVLVANGQKKPIRPWLTVTMDAYSRAIVGIWVDVERPTGQSIALALHHAMLPKANADWLMHGIPESILFDNGDDYRFAPIREVFTRLGIEQRHFGPELSRARGQIERWFRTLEDMCTRYMKGYVGRNRERHSVDPHPCPSQLEIEIATFIVATYHERKHRTTQTSPLAMWQQDMQSVRVVEDARLLDVLLPSATGTVEALGVSFKGHTYRALNGNLAAHTGESVQVFYHPDDATQVHLYSTQGEYICTAVAA
jgi:putative transposase